MTKRAPNLTTPVLTGLAPVIGSNPRLLILGSMPGSESLRLQQYYAHPRNAFWPILCTWAGIDLAESSYRQRCSALQDAGIVLWDVLRSCRRPGSLDAAIEPASIQCNDIAGLLAAHSSLQSVCCNGASAQRWFRRLVLPGLADPPAHRGLPSTSPAYAAMTYAEKCRLWCAALDRALA